jgi:hypothetical protein
MRHPCERWGTDRLLNKLIFLAVREALNAPAHPDSKRQDRRKQRDLTRYGARILKRDGVLSCPARKINGRRERKDMQRRLADERKEMARNVSLRLQGKGWMLPSKKPEVPVDVFEFQAYLQQLAETAMGTGENYA